MKTKDNIILLYLGLLLFNISCSEEDHLFDIKEAYIPYFKYDPGIGVVYQSAMEYSSYQREIEIYNDTLNKNVIATAKIDINSLIHSYDLDMLINDSTGLVYDAFIEYDFEYKGLPLITLGKKYVEVIYGYTDLGKNLTGWIELDDFTEYSLWKDHLFDRVCYFSNGSFPMLYDTINGNIEDFEFDYTIAYNDGKIHLDYNLYPLDTVNGWMKAEIHTPSTYCSGEENQVRISTYWLKYIDMNHRPLLWFYPRGC